jgi:hypothetical protein
LEQVNKQKYVTPTLKEHGAVSELTQTGSGGSPHQDKRDKHKHHKGRRKKKWWKRWW